MGAETEMGPKTEGNVGVWSSVELRDVWVVEGFRVTIGRRPTERDATFWLHLETMDIGAYWTDPSYVSERDEESKEFLRGVFDPLWVFKDPIEV
jgi:hypothetical protein